jgi:hypothetical protein
MSTQSKENQIIFYLVHSTKTQKLYYGSVESQTQGAVIFMEGWQLPSLDASRILNFRKKLFHGIQNKTKDCSFVRIPPIPQKHSKFCFLS